MKTQRDTSDFVCKKLLSKLPITDKVKILEPSAGNGKIITYLLEHYHWLKDCEIVMVELNKERIQKAGEDVQDLNTQNDVFFYQQDFLKMELGPSKPYDIAVGAPPFKNNVDLEHIMHMYKFLKYKGMMASLTSPYWLTNNEPHQVAFRQWLEDKDYQITMLPDNSFIEKEKTVPTAIITIYKKERHESI